MWEILVSTTALSQQAAKHVVSLGIEPRTLWALHTGPKLKTATKSWDKIKSRRRAVSVQTVYQTTVTTDRRAAQTVVPQRERSLF